MPILEFEVTRPATSRQLERLVFELLPSNSAPVLAVTARLVAVDVPRAVADEMMFSFAITAIYLNSRASRPAQATLIHRLAGQAAEERPATNIVIRFSEDSELPAQLSAVVSEADLPRYLRSTPPAR